MVQRNMIQNGFKKFTRLIKSLSRPSTLKSFKFSANTTKQENLESGVISVDEYISPSVLCAYSTNEECIVKLLLIYL